MQAEKKFLEFDGKKLFYVNIKNGDVPIIYIPGWLPTINLSPYHNFQKKDFIERISGFDFYIFNLSNLYKSTFSALPMTIDNYIDEIAQIIRSLGFEKVHLWGHSAGGRFIIAFQDKYPELVDKIVLFNSAGLSHKDASIKMISRAHYFFGKFLVNDEQKKLLQETFQNVYNSNVSEKIKKISKQTYLIWGELDETIKVTRAYRFKELNPLIELKIYPSLGHLTMINPEVQTDVIRFLKS